MKRFFLLLASAGSLFLLANSCKGDKENNPSNLEQEEIIVPVNIPEGALPASEVGSLAVLDIKDNGIVNSDASGDLELSVPAEGHVSVVAELSDDTPIPVPGELLLKSNDDVPAVCQSESGAQFANAKIVLTLENPSDDPVVYTGIIEADGVTVDMPEILVPAKAQKFQAILMDNPGDTENGIQLPKPIVDKVNKLGKDAIKIKDVYVSKFNTRADNGGSGTYTFSVAAIYVAPLVFPKGTVIDFVIPLNDLGEVNPSKYVGNAKEYELKASVTSTLPFEISGFGETPTGVKANLVDKDGNVISIAPGNTNKPVTTEVIVHFVCNGNMNVFNQATIHLKLRALETAVLNKKQNLVVNYNGITFHMQA